MGPRKRPQTIKSAPVKRKKVDAKRIRDFQETPKTDSTDDCNIYLSLLPDDVLLKIYSFLSPADLSSLCELKNQRLTDLTYTVREVKISSCRLSNPLVVSTFFNTSRVEYIQKLNFNYYFYIRPFELTNLICLCKNLTTLSVVECGLRYNNILNILQNCTKLEELAWNILKFSQRSNICCPKMKRVYLFCDHKIIYFPNTLPNCVYYTIKNFPNIENVWINYTPDSISAMPFIGLWLGSSCVSSAKLAKQFTLTASINFLKSRSRDNTDAGRHFKILRQLMNELHGNDHGDPSDPVQSRMSNSPPYLQIRSINEDIAVLSSGPFNAYSTVAIILTSEIISVSESLIKCIKDVAGGKLIHLSLQSESENVAPNDNPLPISDEETLAACDMLDQMFLTSKNITVLDLTTVHFNKGSPIKAITQLTHLKVLSIPSCAFCSSDKLSHFQSFNLSNVVSSCPKVEDFALNCCINDSEQLKEDDIVCIKDWLHLKHLSMYSVVLHTCNFLKEVADSCVELQSLSLVSVPRGKDCLYIDDVIYVLKKAQNLKCIRINEENFCTTNKQFWNAIGEAVNLEGICISTSLTAGPVDEKIVIKGIKKLKYLHLFHFWCAVASDHLYNEVKKSMEEHGIKNINIAKSERHVLTGGCEVPHYKHLQPVRCSLLHLKDIDIF